MRNTSLRKNNGITLIALVITIIVLIILAGVSLTLVLGQNGIIQRAKNAKVEQTLAEIQEEVNLKIFAKAMEKVEAGTNITGAEVEAILTPYGEVIKNADGTIKSLKPTGMTEEIAIEKLYAGEIKVEKTFAQKITKNNYGEYVDLETTILARNAEGQIALQLELGQEGNITGTEQPLTDWRIFYKDNQGGIYLMLTGYLPYSYENTLQTGLTNEGSSYPYNWKSGTSRVDLIDRLNGTTNSIENNNSNVWNSLLASKYITKGLTVKGAIDIETFKESFNEKSNIKMFLAKSAEMDDGLEGYYLKGGSSENITSSYIYNFKDSTAYKDTTLYYPYKSSVNNNYGYWLASPSAYNTLSVMIVNYNGYVGWCYYNTSSCDYGVRPVVYLPSGISATKNATTGIWTID